MFYTGWHLAGIWQICLLVYCWCFRDVLWESFPALENWILHTLWTDSLPSRIVLPFSRVNVDAAVSLNDGDDEGKVSSGRIQKYAALTEEGVLNVHIVPHTHDDVGWLKTVEQYFYGWNTSIADRGYVNQIISTSIESLLLNPHRTFTYVESKYLSMWWSEASPQQQESLRHLIEDKQWTFANGGWSMHDEGCAHFMGMVDSTTLGHDFLLRHWQYIPTVAWQLDPFGHSATQASLLTHKMGMNAIYFGRIDSQDRFFRQQQRNCEGLWNPTSNHANSHASVVTVDPTIFWGLTGSYQYYYGPPYEFCFDIFCYNNKPLVELDESDRNEKAALFLYYLAIQANQTKQLGQQDQEQDILMTFGDDFTYSHAERYFSNLDLLINTVMLGQEWNLWNMSLIFQGQGIHKVNLFYSSPEYYTERKFNLTVKAAEAAKKRRKKGDSEKQDQGLRYSNPNKESRMEESSSWSIKTDDFFPYSSCPHCFWTGYFTSRTAFKRFERVASGFLQAARQLDLLLDKSRRQKKITAETHALYRLEDALGVSQHHDSITGTAKQHVANDYSKRLQAGLDQASDYVANIIQETLNATFSLHYCSRLNESICEPARTTRFDLGQELYVVVYNPLAKQRNWNIRIPVSFLGFYSVERIPDSTQSILSTKKNLWRRTLQAQPAQSLLSLGENGEPNDAVYEVEFMAGPLPPLGGITYRISLIPKSQEERLLSSKKSERERLDLVEIREHTIQVSNGCGLVVTFDRETGQMQHVSFDTNQNGRRTVSVSVEEQWGYYKPFDGALDGDGDSSSGAYIFRPSTPNQTLQSIGRTGAPKFLPTNQGLEVQITYGEGSWIRQSVRVVKDLPWIEVEYTVGPVPIEEGRGKEVVSRYKVHNLHNKGVFYTDSNGRSFLKRKRDFRPSWNMTVHEPVAGNYYPVNAAIYIEDKNVSFVLLTDRSRGGSSIVDGSLEVKVQRRTLADDGCGLAEPLNETSGGMTPYPPYGDASRIGEGVVVRGIHRLMVGLGNHGASLARSAMDEIFAQPVIMVGSPPRATTLSLTPLSQPTFSVLGGMQLPPNIFLMTLKHLYDEKLEKTTFLLRLAHQYGHGEDEIRSKPVEVNLEDLFRPKYKIVSITEKTLSGNRNWKEFVLTKYNWTSPQMKKDSRDVTGDYPTESNSTVTLNPLDIRTFHVVVKSNMQ